MFGYRSQASFLMGKSDFSSNLTWNPNDDDSVLDFKQVSDLVYKHDYSEVITNSYNPGGLTLDTELMNILPFGYCLKLQKSMTEFFISSQPKDKLKVIFVDQNVDVKFNIRQSLVDSIEFGGGEVGATYDYFKVELKWYDRRILDGYECTDYEKVSISI